MLGRGALDTGYLVLRSGEYLILGLEIPKGPAPDVSYPPAIGDRDLSSNINRPGRVRLEYTRPDSGSVESLINPSMALKKLIKACALTKEF